MEPFLFASLGLHLLEYLKQLQIACSMLLFKEGWWVHAGWKWNFQSMFKFLTVSAKWMYLFCHLASDPPPLILATINFRTSVNSTNGLEEIVLVGCGVQHCFSLDGGQWKFKHDRIVCSELFPWIHIANICGFWLVFHGIVFGCGSLGS